MRLIIAASFFNKGQEIGCMSTPSLGGLLREANGDSDGMLPVAGRFDGNHILVPLLTREIPPVLDQLKTNDVGEIHGIWYLNRQF